MDNDRNSAVLYRNLNAQFLSLARGRGIYLELKNGLSVIDASGGAAVACIGHGDQRVRDAIVEQLDKIAYCSTLFYTSDVCEKLCQELVNSTNGHMSRAYIVSSGKFHDGGTNDGTQVTDVLPKGSEAMEASMKLARQYFLEKPQPEPHRTKFIARNMSYHGTTLGSLSMGGHVSRRAKFEPMLLNNISKVSRCFSYRDQGHRETDESYVARLADELDKEFQRLGPENVCAFVAEPVVGAALGCVPAVRGYFKAVRAVCDKYGALLILDEVMCGMGRTGTLHAWEQEDVVPDIQTLGKCLGGGYQPIAGVLVARRVVDILANGSGSFIHGHTYQGHPIACAAALEVQRIIRDEQLLVNVRQMGELLSKRLAESLQDHPNVGSIRGRGLFWGLEFVSNKSTKEPFPVAANVAMGLAELGLTKPYRIAIYPGSGTVDGVNGDHVIISPPYNITAVEVEEVVEIMRRLVDDFFSGKVQASL
ncbi:Aminotransferase [Apiospora sp. TS-2023a]